jgi:hypothetical protein
MSFGPEIDVNTVLKMVVQPAFFLVLALALGVKSLAETPGSSCVHCQWQ